MARAGGCNLRLLLCWENLLRKSCKYGKFADLWPVIEPKQSNMAATPYYKVSTPEHGYCASFKFAEDAVQFCMTHEGAVIRNRWGTALWNDATDQAPDPELPKYDSWDAVMEVMASRDKGVLNPQNA